MSALSQFIELYKSGKISTSTMVKAATFKQELEKRASPNLEMFLKYLATGLAVSAGMGVAAAGVGLGVNAYETHVMEGKKTELFEEVLKLHPDLLPNKKRALLYFEALIHFSPQVATNPLTAGAYIRQALQYDHVAGGPLPASVNELTQIQKQTVDAKRNNPPSSVLGTIFSGLGEGPAKTMPGMPSFHEFNT